MAENQEKELLRLCRKCYRSLRRKYPARSNWTPEFQAGREYLQNHAQRSFTGLGS